MYTDFSRRNNQIFLTPAEKAIYDAMQKVEDMPADVRLTDAVNLLQQAQNKVADYVDEQQQLKNCNLQNVNHRFLTMKNTHDWGISILHMEESGKAFCRTYWYFDDKSTIYLDWLNVIETARGNGIATELLDQHRKIADEMKVESCLSVRKGTWMHEWYKRKGYKDLKNNENESNSIWMNRLPEN